MTSEAVRGPVLAVFGGTFDPVTLGHEEMVGRAAALFDHLIVAVAAAHHKKTMFSLEERVAMVEQVFSTVPNITVRSFSALMRDFVVEQGAQVMVRGVRGLLDFGYEMQLAGLNRKLMPDVETIFMAPSANHQHISSTYVREIAALGGEVAQFVSPSVAERLTAHTAEQQKS